MGIVDDAVEDGVGEGGFADDVVPLRQRQLAGDQDDREALKRPLPAPFDACDKQGTRVNSLSRLANNGVDLAVTQRLLGHSSPVVTMRYYTSGAKF